MQWSGSGGRRVGSCIPNQTADVVSSPSLCPGNCAIMALTDPPPQMAHITQQRHQPEDIAGQLAEWAFDPATRPLTGSLLKARLRFRHVHTC